MAFAKALCLLLIPCLTLTRSVHGETTPDYNIYNRVLGETTPDYNIYDDERQDSTEPHFVLNRNMKERSIPKEGFTILPKPFEETNPDRVEAGQLFDKDMLLTEAQWRDLALRKGLASQNYRWPESGDGFPHVPYRFADANVDQVAVKAGIAHWEQHTCLKLSTKGNRTATELTE
nr:uncharacterized protein LOC113817628 [Penaeus vannamei]